MHKGAGCRINPADRIFSRILHRASLWSDFHIPFMHFEKSCAGHHIGIALRQLQSFFLVAKSFVIAGIIAVLPELSIGVLAAVEGSSALGFGVILGANVADLTLVIGVVALSAGQLKLDAVLIKNMRLSFLAVILPVLLFIDGEISRVDGTILIVAFLLYLFNLLRTKRGAAVVNGRKPRLRLLFEVAVLGVSLGFLFIGGTLITDNAQVLSASLGLPLFLVGAVVAVGTCLPEMAFAVRASKKRHGALGLGNIFGNVLADSMLTIGVIALIAPIKPQFPTSALSVGVFMAVSALVVYGLSRDGVLDRRNGLVLVFMYVLFIVFQALLEGMAT